MRKLDFSGWQQAARPAGTSIGTGMQHAARPVGIQQAARPAGASIGIGRMLAAALIVILCACVIISMSATSVYAMPAYNGDIHLSQPDGTTFTARMSGDEYFHYYVNDDGTVIQKDQDSKTWKQVFVKGGKLYMGVRAETGKTAGKKAAAAKASSLCKASSLSSSTYKARYYALGGLKYSGKTAPARKVVSLSSIRKSNSLTSMKKLTAQSVDADTAIPLLAIVIGFSDVAYNNDYDWNDKIFNGSNSVADYYSDVSQGQFTFAPARETSLTGADGNNNQNDTVNDGVVHVTLNRSHGNWQGNFDDESVMADLNSALSDAVKASESYVDYGVYDTDGDGEISAQELSVLFIVAGQESSSGYTDQAAIWAHQYDLDPYISVDGVSVGHYIAMGETMAGKNSAGTVVRLQNGTNVVCHELGHILGLPDLYDPYYGESNVKEWKNYSVSGMSLMAYGSWGNDGDPFENTSKDFYPTYLDPYCRILLGYITPTRIYNSGTYSVNSEKSGHGYNALLIQSKDKNQIFLIENRQFQGFDRGLAGLYGNDYSKGLFGVVVWHVDKATVTERGITDASGGSASNTINSIDHSPGIMEAYYEEEPAADAAVDAETTGVNTPLIDYPAMNSAVVNKYPNFKFNTQLYKGDLIKNRVDSGISVTADVEGADCMKVTVKMPLQVKAPTKVKAVAKGSRAIRVSWNKGINGKVFKVYRATSKNGKYTRIKTTKITSYTNSSLKAGKRYYYKIRSYNGTTASESYTAIVSAKANK
ncbi:M6 family metalloprotease domain-containing protein [Aminicella lysinilytica]|uniref:M6 family metalloprotease-like protein n=1 Tax=Aminicella lysinilytica TaxID=433323 RepID=A0A4R6Q6T4_9FIRM|nr:M6 family metalloprotease domain-containing protein [Aminicella lysinilytica]TDP57755.1 M6 family metalloprotease-like protein [Aminicella lysinilytica]